MSGRRWRERLLGGVVREGRSIGGCGEFHDELVCWQVEEKLGERCE
jgi:hypothetical protein